MIDYDKLKLAHELANEYGKIKDSYIALTSYAYYKNRNHTPDTFILKLSIDEDDLSFDSIDTLISLLTELTQPDKIKHKYEVGHKVWHLFHEELEESIIDEIENGTQVLYRLSTGWWTEEQLYPSREALIEAQIDYWNKLLHPTVQESTKEAYENEKEFIKSHADKWNKYWNSQEKCLGKSKEACKHEQCAIPEMVFRCIKCGEFYR